jgi:hypothetical protein
MNALAAFALALTLHAGPDEGRAALAPFKKALKEALEDGMKGGPEATIDVCRVRAPALALAYSRDGVKVGRSALKLRNPSANAPPAWLAPVMAEFAQGPRGATEPKVVQLPGGRTGYAEAIWTQPVCLTCHGVVAAPVAARLDAAYPKDTARGFEVGDFRGVFWAELPARPASNGRRDQQP